MHIVPLLILICVFILSANSLIIKDSGINIMKRGDVGMVFYITIENTKKKNYHINVKMLHCVELLSENEQEAEAIYLIGGYMGILYSKSTLKATLIYPNMYLYNRKGICTISIHYINEYYETREIRTHIKFNTTPKNGDAAPEIADFYKNKKVKYCESPDQDQLEECIPVDCVMKYSGHTSYYSDQLKRCQKVPICVSDPEKSDPDVAYIPTSNRCRNLEKSITESDIAMLEEGLITNITERLLSCRGLIVRCNHGIFDNSTGICSCDRGWTSAEPDTEKYIPGLSVYHMCNIRVNSWNTANIDKVRSTVLAFAILAVIITMAILLITFCLYGLYICMRNYESMSPFDPPSDDSSDLELESPWSSDKSVHIR